MRKALFPALREAYDKWLEDDSIDHLEKISLQGQDHWLSVAKSLQELFQKEGKIDREKFLDFIESRAL